MLCVLREDPKIKNPIVLNKEGAANDSTIDLAPTTFLDLRTVLPPAAADTIGPAFNGGRCRIRTCDFHRVKVPFQGHFIDGKGLKSRRSRQNRHNRRYLPQKCHKLFKHNKPS